MLCMSDRLGCSVSIPCCFGSRPLSCGPFPVLGVAGIRWNGPGTLTPATSPGNEDGGKGANKKRGWVGGGLHLFSTFAFDLLLPLAPRVPRKWGREASEKTLVTKGPFSTKFMPSISMSVQFCFRRGCCTQQKKPPSDFSMPMGQIRG